MSEEAQETVEEPTTEVEETQDAETPAQESTDWKAEARKWEERSKSNYTDLQKAQEASDSLSKELEKLRESIKELEAKNGEYKAAQERQTVLEKVAEETGVPKNLLRGDTEEELKEHAELLKTVIDSKPVAPAVKTQGSRPATEARDPWAIMAERLKDS